LSGTFIITSGAYAGSDFVSNFGLLPPAFLPIANKRLYDTQAALVKDVRSRKLLSIPADFQITKYELEHIATLGFELIRVPLGLSLGASIAYVLKQAAIKGDQLRILHGDTLVLDFPFGRLDVVSEGMTAEYYSWAEFKTSADGKIYYFDGLLEGSAFNSPGGKRSVLSGYFCFSDADLYIRSLERADHNFIPSLNEYAGECPLTPVNTGFWLDLGHLGNYYQSKAQITTERAFNEMDISSRTVRKFSEDKDKMRAESAWFKNLPNPLKVFAPQFLGEFSNDTGCGYKTEYLYLSTLSDLHVFGRLPTYVWQRIFQSCDDFLNAGKNFRPDVLPPQSDRLYREKTVERLEAYAEQSSTDLDRDWHYGGKTLPSLRAIVRMTADAIRPPQPEDFQVVHGDFCFSNIFYDFRAKAIRVVDPRGTMTGNTPTIYGDIRYDIAKLYHSAVGGYDLIICGQHMLEDNGGYELALTLPADQDIEERQVVFRERTFAGHCMARAAALPISILLFLSMLPLHHDRPDRQRAFIARALRLYADMDA